MVREYVYPEIHVGCFAPSAMVRSLTGAGLRTQFPGFLPGYTGILRHKVLERLGIKEWSPWERLLPCLRLNARSTCA